MGDLVVNGEVKFYTEWNKIRAQVVHSVLLS
jgi:hypothetical protein